MTTTEVASDTKQVVKSGKMPRRPTKPKASDKLTKVTLMLPTEMVEAIEEEARKRTQTDEMGRTVTRTDIFRVLIKGWLASKEG